MCIRDRGLPVVTTVYRRNDVVETARGRLEVTSAAVVRDLNADFLYAAGPACTLIHIGLGVCCTAGTEVKIKVVGVWPYSTKYMRAELVIHSDESSIRRKHRRRKDQRRCF